MNIAPKEIALTESIIAAIRRVVGNGPCALHEPMFKGNEWEYLKNCLDTTYVSSVGSFIERFESDLVAFTGARHAVVVSNGTAGLHIALKLAGVGPNDEVLVPTLTFVATSNAVSYCGAIPHFVDSSETTLGVDPGALREYLSHIAEMRSGACFNRSTGRVIRALVPMHVVGHPADVDRLFDITREFKLVLIEDAAESLGSFIGQRHTGTVGLAGVISFNGNKTITTGGGGAIITNDAGFAKKAKHLATTAKSPHPWLYWHDEVGYNYRMPNLNAALGCAQLEQLTSFLELKRKLHDQYAREFSNVAGVRLMHEPAGCRSSYWLQTLLLDPAVEGERDAILSATNEAGMMTRPIWTLNHRLPAFQDNPRMPLSVSESLERRIINIPSSPQLSR